MRALCVTMSVALALVITGEASSAHLGLGAKPNARVKLTAGTLRLPAPAPGHMIIGVLKSRSTHAGAIAAARKSYSIRLAKAPSGLVVVTIVHTAATKKAATRTVLFVLDNRKGRALASRSVIREEPPRYNDAYVKVMSLFLVGFWIADDPIFLTDEQIERREETYNLMAALINADKAAKAKEEAKFREEAKKLIGPWNPEELDPTLDTGWYDDGHAFGWHMHDKAIVGDWRKLMRDGDLNEFVDQIEADLANGGPPPGSEGCTFTGTGTITGTAGVDVICGGIANDVCRAGDGDDTCKLGAGNNTCTLGGGKDRCVTGSGNDTCTGGTGNDTCTVGDGNNTCDLGAGNDRCVAGSGDDLCKGGPGRDRCDLGAGANRCESPGDVCRGSTAPPPTGNYTCVGDEFKLFDNWNGFSVENGGTPPTFGTNGKAYCLDWVATYHWNDGKGSAPGTISLVGGGKTLGPWTAVGQAPDGGPGNINWIATPAAQVILNGTYTCRDSNPATWSTNADSRGGFCRVAVRNAQKQ